MAQKIYLAARPALGSTSWGHLYFILWDDVAQEGRTIAANQDISEGILQGKDNSILRRLRK
mgnify:CR=1 FL=1